MKIETNAEKVKEFLRNPNAEEARKFVAVHECVVLRALADPEMKAGTIYKFSESAIEMMRMMNDAACSQAFLLYHRQSGITARGEQLLKEKENVGREE